MDGDLASEPEKLRSENPELRSESDALQHRLNSRPARATLKRARRWIFDRLPAGVRAKLGPAYIRIRERSSTLFDSSANARAIQALVDDRNALTANGPPARLPLTPPTPDVWPEIDVGVVTYNSTRWIEGFFGSLLAQDYPLERIHLRFVDNGSTDETITRLEGARAAHADRFGTFEILRRPNRGYGAGHDAAIRAGHAPFCLVTNVDLVFERDAIGRIAGLAVADDAAVASWEFRQKPYEHPKYYDPVTGKTNWCSHACVLIRRSAYEAVGGYEPRIFMYGEDVELSYRLRRAGYDLRYVPAAVVWHFSYENAGEVKPLQFRGSTLANALLRLRYGTLYDMIAGAILLWRLRSISDVYPGSRRDARRAFRQYLTNAPAFLFSRRRSRAKFPFRRWDYEMIREGAFLEGKPLPGAGPLVSIVIRTFGGRAALLTQAVLAAAQQSYPFVEVIVVEDGGSENQSVVDALASATTVPVRYRGLPKVGRSRAGNAGLEMASGQYAMFLDDDDLVFADHVETLMAALADDPGARAAYSLAWQVPTSYADAERTSYTERSYDLPALFRQPFEAEVLWHHNFMPIQSVLFETALFRERGGLDPELEALEDWNLWLRYSADTRFIYVPKVTSLFRVPAEETMLAARHEVLHQAYETAKNKARSDVERLTVPQDQGSSSAGESKPSNEEHRPAGLRIA